MGSQGLLTYFAVLIFVFLLLATASGRWTRSRHIDQTTTWSEVGLWETCGTCADLKKDDCSKRIKYINTVEAFSLIEVAGEFLIVSLLVLEAFKYLGSRIVYRLTIVCVAVAIVANIISWTTYSGYFKESNFCGPSEPSFHDAGFRLSWGYALRLGELGGLAILAIVLVVGMCKGSAERSALSTFTIMFALFVLLLGIITTSGRGWMQNRATGIPKTALYVGLWDACECEQIYDLECGKQLRRFRAAEAFSVIAIVLQFALIYMMIRGRYTVTRLNVTRFLAFLSLVAMLITMTVFAEAATTTVCGLIPITDNQRLHWGFAIQCVAFICQFLLTVALVIVTIQEPPEMRVIVYPGAHPVAA